MARAPNDSVAAFFPRRGDWTWTQVTEGAPPGHPPTVWRFAAPETLRTAWRSGSVCEAFLGFMGPYGDDLLMRTEADGTRWRRITGNRFVPPGESARSPMFVQWRREDGRWVVSAFGDVTPWSPRLAGEFRGGGVVRDTVLRLPPTPFYAAAAPWFVDNRSISFEGYPYLKYGLPRALADSLITRIGRFGRMGVYAAKNDVVGEVLYIPVAPGEYQPYQAAHGRGNHCF
jgi:hypothetical protein